MTARWHATARRSCGLDGRSERLLPARGARNTRGAARRRRDCFAQPRAGLAMTGLRGGSPYGFIC